jgi:hypothetical protein
VAAYSTEHTGEYIARYVFDPKAICLVRLGQTRLWQGDPGDARALFASGRSHGEGVGHPGTLMYVFSYGAMVAIELGDLDMAQRCLAEFEALADRFGGSSLYWFEAMHGLFSACLVVAGGDSGGLGPLAEIVRSSHSSTQSLLRSYGLLTLGRGYARSGDVDAGRHVVGEALAWADDHDQHYLDAALWLAEAALLDRSSGATGARAARQRALGIARDQGAGWYEQQAIAELADDAS